MNKIEATERSFGEKQPPQKPAYTLGLANPNASELLERRIRQRLDFLEELAGELREPKVTSRSVDYFLPADFRLSICVPVYNQQHTIALVIERLRRLPISCEIIIVDDASTDGTRSILEELARRYPLRILYHNVNQGKGAAVRTALAESTGDMVVIQDADLEYNPDDLIDVLRPIAIGDADVCYGSRFAPGPDDNSSWIHRLGNKALTWLSNRLTGLELTDMETCYKAMHRQVLEGLVIEQNRFGLEPELTAKLARQGWRFAECPISFEARGWNEGKKIGWRDGISAVTCILWYGWRVEA
ncbi:MAG: glycosyltransferase family 2 protein [Pirellulaceae bacterium]